MYNVQGLRYAEDNDCVRLNELWGQAVEVLTGGPGSPLDHASRIERAVTRVGKRGRWTSPPRRAAVIGARPCSDRRASGPTRIGIFLKLVEPEADGRRLC